MRLYNTVVAVLRQQENWLDIRHLCFNGEYWYAVSDEPVWGNSEILLKFPDFVSKKTEVCQIIINYRPAYYANRRDVK